MKSSTWMPALALLAATLAAGCENRYEAITAPPPGLTADLDDEDNVIRISKGVSMAFECTTQEGDPCGPEATSSNGGIAGILRANLDVLTEGYDRHGPRARSVYVVVGIAPGRTTVRAGGEGLSVEVLPPGR